MGAWGIGAFEDDTSLDWLEEEYAAAGRDAVRAALQLAVSTSAEDYLDYEAGVNARAAAEIVALSQNAGANGISEDRAEDISIHLTTVSADDALPALAQRAVARVDAGNSEIRDLWCEDGDCTEWDAAIKDLTARLGRL